jgi:hypothetical protein
MDQAALDINRAWRKLAMRRLRLQERCGSGTIMPTTIQHWDEVDGDDIPMCQPGASLDDAVYTKEDNKGNKFEIFCKNGAYQGVFTPKDKPPVYIGKCKYDDGHNTIRKKVTSRFELKPLSRPDPDVPGGSIISIEPVYLQPPEEIEKIFWKTIKPVGPPPTSGTAPYGAMGTSEDLLWIYDSKTNELIVQPTKHTGNWQLKPKKDDVKKRANWRWVVSTQEDDGEPTKKQAPETAEGLGMVSPGPRRSCTITSPESYADVTVAPFTVVDDRETYACTLTLPRGSRDFQIQRVEATVGKSFRIEIVLPHKEERLLRFALLDAPSGMTINRRTGVINWMPKANQVGAHKVTIVHRYHELTAHVDEFILPVKAAGRARPKDKKSKPRRRRA